MTLNTQYIPESWQTFEAASEQFYTTLANKYLELIGSDAPETLALAHINENLDFALNPENIGTGAGDSETQGAVIDFGAGAFKMSCEQVAELWQDALEQRFTVAK